MKNKHIHSFKIFESKMENDFLLNMYNFYKEKYKDDDLFVKFFSTVEKMINSNDLTTGSFENFINSIENNQTKKELQEIYNFVNMIDFKIKPKTKPRPPTQVAQNLNRPIRLPFSGKILRKKTDI